MLEELLKMEREFQDNLQDDLYIHVEHKVNALNDMMCTQDAKAKTDKYVAVRIVKDMYYENNNAQSKLKQLYLEINLLRWLALDKYTTLCKKYIFIEVLERIILGHLIDSEVTLSLFVDNGAENKEL